MEPKLRGYVEQSLDNFLREERMNGLVKWFKSYKDTGMIKSIECAIFGAIVGGLVSTLAFHIAISDKELNDEIRQELINLIQGRIVEIKSKISKASGL